MFSKMNATAVLQMIKYRKLLLSSNGYFTISSFGNVALLNLKKAI
jgi:hypothetical protein